MQGVHPDGNLATSAQKWWQALKGASGVWSMVENPDAIDQVERLWSEREFEDVRLDGREAFMVGKIQLRRIDGVAQINTDDTTTPAKHDIGEATHATADVEHHAAADVRRRPTGPLSEGALGERAPRTVQLGRSMECPLVAEIGDILVIRDEARDSVADRVSSPTLATAERCLTGVCVYEG